MYLSGARREVKSVAEYRKELPLSFLASKLMEKRASIIRAGSSCSNSISDGDDASLGSQGSSASSVVLDLDSSDVELMRLAVAKVVDGFTRTILDYYSFAWESLIAMRDHGRHKEKIRKAIRIQCWFRGFWSQLAVKRKKEQIRLEEERIARQRAGLKGGEWGEVQMGGWSIDRKCPIDR